MKTKFMLLFLIIFVLPSVTFASTAYYVDPSAASDGNGTYAFPWKYIASVNAHHFSSGDDVYFKTGTTLFVPPGQFFDITWNGSANDWVIIGAYYGDSKFGLNGGMRPILNGKSNAPGKDSYAGLINKRGWDSQSDSFLSIENIQIDFSGCYGLQLHTTKNAAITNCYTNHSWAAGISVCRVNTATVSSNIVSDSQYGGGIGASLEVGGNDAEGLCKNIIVSNNQVSRGSEGIGVYKKAEYVTVTGNEVYDQKSYNIYVDASKYTTITNNIVYTSGSSPNKPQPGIVIDNEAERSYCFISTCEISSNYIANTSYGIMLAAQKSGCLWDNVQVHDNIVVDSTISNFMIWGPTTGWKYIDIYHNISYTTNNATHCNNYSQAEINWGINCFDDSVSGNAGVNAIKSTVLAKTTGWTSLPAGNVTVSYFNRTNEGIALLGSAFAATTKNSIVPPRNLIIK